MMLAVFDRQGIEEAHDRQKEEYILKCRDGNVHGQCVGQLMGSPRTNSEWGGAEEVSQVRLAGPQSRTVLEASEQIDLSRR